MKRASRWRVAAASATGSSHVRLGLPCQDSATAKVFHDADDDEVLVVVVSDGAGSASRAEIGSSIACSTVAEAAEVYFAGGGRLEAIDLDVAISWLQMVQKAIAIRAEEDIGTPRDYACTLLVAVVGQDSSAIMQIGDGAIVVSDGAGWSWVHWPQRGEFANTTFFATDEQAEKRMAFDFCKGRIEEIAVFSDGIEPLVLEYSTQTVFASFFDKMFPAVRALHEEGLDQGLSTALATYLDSPAICARTDDDKTLVLATRASAAPDSPAQDSVIPSEGTDE
jgi:hypothetical protein